MTMLATAPQALATVPRVAFADAALAEIVDLWERAEEDVQLHERAASTRAAYARDFATFEAWCQSRGAASMPAEGEIVYAYVRSLVDHGLKLATIQRRLAALSVAHASAGYSGEANPVKNHRVRRYLRALRRKLGVRQVRKSALTTDDLRKVVHPLPRTTIGIRDRALLLAGFAGAFRRSELVALDFEDVRFVDEGVEITLKRSKTDQEGRGQVKVLAYGSTLETCPVRALRAWLAHAAIETGPLFLPVDRHGNVRRRRLSGQVVARVVKQRATQAGFESVDMLAGHSLRAGFVTVARENGVPDHAIQRQTGHASTAMLARYDRPKSLWKNAASSALGL